VSCFACDVLEGRIEPPGGVIDEGAEEAAEAIRQACR
jgi:hypothetical protein